MKSKLIEVVVLDTVQAAAADVLWPGAGLLAITGEANPIDWRRLNPKGAFSYKAYSAGVARAATLTFDNTAGAVRNETIYVVRLKKTLINRVNLGMIDARTIKNTEEVYTYTSDATATATEIAQGIRTKILAAIANGLSDFATCTGAGAVLTLTQANLFMTWNATCDNGNALTPGTSIMVEAETVAYVEPSLTAAEINALNPKPAALATIGNTYREYIWRDLAPDEANSVNGSNGAGALAREIRWYVNAGSANIAAFHTEVYTNIAAGSATGGPAVYLASR